MEVRTAAHVALGAVHSNRYVGGRVVHHKSVEFNRSLLPCTVKCTLCRCHVVASQGSEGGVHLVAHTAVVGVRAVRVVNLHRDDINWDAIIVDLHLVDGCKSNSPASCLGGVVWVQQLNRRATRLAGLVIGGTILLCQVVAWVLHGTLGGSGTLIPSSHIPCDEVSPRSCRVDVVQRHIVVLLRAGGVVQCLDVGIVVRTFDDVSHATLCKF